MQYKTKSRLIDARKRKGYKQDYISSTMGMDISSYSRRESGEVKISNKEWIKLSEILETPLEEIYESEDNMILIFNDNSSGNNSSGNIVTNYTLPQSVLDSQRKYIEMLEEEVRNYKEEVRNLKEKIRTLTMSDLNT